jgi:uncharacterized C2H2 Zn-finger protein
MTMHYKTPTPICPHCGHVMDTDEMSYGAPTCDADLFALAPNEDQAVIKCPSCDAEFWVQGGYTPHYTSAFSWEEF